MSEQKKIDDMYAMQAELEAEFQAEMEAMYMSEIDTLSETSVPVEIEENIEFDSIIDPSETSRESGEEEIENVRKKAQEMSEELIAAQKYTNLTDINNDIVSMVENSDLAEMFPNEVMDYETSADPMEMLFDLADNEKNAEAQNILGVCYFSGTNVKADVQKSMEYFRDAAIQGHSAAARNLAIVMESSENRDANEIISLYEKAAEKNDAYAINNLAVAYLTGDGVDKDVKKAVNLFEKAAKLGDDYALVNLAYCYSIGNGVKFSEKEAFRMFEKAAEKGNIEGLRNAAEYLIAGKGTKQNFETALSYFTKAAQLGDVRSQERVEELSDKLSGIKHEEVAVNKPTEKRKKSLSDVLTMGKEAAEYDNAAKSSEKAEPTVPKNKGDR